MRLDRETAYTATIFLLPCLLLLDPPRLRAENTGIAQPSCPLRFEKNLGQTDKRVRFIGRSAAQTVFLTPDSVLIHFGKSKRGLQLDFQASLPNHDPRGLDLLSARVNYFHGSSSNDWHTNIPAYERVLYPNLYPGIDLVFYGAQRELEYDFVIEPYRDPDSIALRIESPALFQLAIARNGDLVASSETGQVRLRRPEAYQLQSSGGRSRIDCKFIARAGNVIGFSVGPYDRSKTLVIDPVLTYSTYLGGTDDEGIFGIQRDVEGNIYLCGETSSLDFPVAGAIQPLEGGDYDAFVAKFDRDGDHLIYATYLGGGKYDHAVGLAVDRLGHAYVAGITFSTNFPVQNALQSTLKGEANGFIAKLDPSGSKLVFSTYWGGSVYDSPGNIVLDRDSNIYVAGITESSDFPISPGAYQAVCDKGAFPGTCVGDAFITKLDTNASKVIYSTYLGGSSYDAANDIAVDETGAAYIGGQTTSSDFPAVSAYQTVLAGQGNGFVAKLSRNGNELVYSTYIGGSQYDSVNGIAVDFFGNAYVTGNTSSPNFPTAHPFQANNAGGTSDAFIAKLDHSGSGLIYSSYLGGSGWDYATRIGIDLFGSASVVGFTTSPDWPVRHPVQGKFGGGFSDAFVAKLNLAGTEPTYSTYLGGSGDEFGYALHSDLLGSIWVGGSTSSKDYPIKDAYQRMYAGGPYDAFLSRLRSDFFDELDSLEQLVNDWPEKDSLAAELAVIRASLAYAPATVTLRALQDLNRRAEQVSDNQRASQLHLAIKELSRQLGAAP